VTPGHSDLFDGGELMAAKIKTHVDPEVYRKAFYAAMKIFELTRAFPKEEMYSLSDYHLFTLSPLHGL
jgi:hypothetical protein